jgi:hypothetical protein
MKTRPALILLLTLVISAGSSAGQPAPSSPAAVTAVSAGTPKAASAGPLSDGDSIQARIVAKEWQELDALKTGSHEVFASLLADDAVFVDAHGLAGKAEVVAHTADFKLEDYSMKEVRFVPLSAAAGLIAYRLTEKGIAHGKAFSAEVYVSAVWVERAGTWVCVFSQETAAK